MSVNVLRKKSENSNVQTVAKSLIKSWKKLLPGEFQTIISSDVDAHGDNAEMMKNRFVLRAEVALS